MSGTILSDLLKIKARYEHARELARESRCSCNTARHPVEVAHDVVEYLLEGDLLSDDLARISLGPRSHHCSVHSPPVSERPWLRELVEAGGGPVVWRVP